MSGAAMTAAEACFRLGVSRETRERLEAYVATLRHWQRRMNLVGAATLADVWRRHVLDCAQIARFVPPGCRRLVDLGSGAGLPGLVLAILGVEGVELVESDARKAAFLRAAAGAAGVRPAIHACRIEELPAAPADVATARALAPLRRLLPLVAPLLAGGGIAILPKGGGVEGELAQAARQWHMWYTRHASVTEARGCLLVIEGLRRETEIPVPAAGRRA